MKPSEILRYYNEEKEAVNRCDAWEKTLPTSKLTDAAIGATWGPRALDDYKASKTLCFPMDLDFQTARPKRPGPGDSL